MPRRRWTGSQAPTLPMLPMLMQMLPDVAFLGSSTNRRNHALAARSRTLSRNALFALF